MTSPSDAERLLPLFEALAVQAGAVIMAVRAQGVHAREKADHSPVTEADEKAEAIILAGLAAHYPDVPVVAEEAASAGNIPQSLGARFFLVDPLDGTKEFVAGREDFTVNIALIENGVPVAGIVYAPARHALYAGAGRRAYRAEVGDVVSPPVPLSRQAQSGPSRIVASRNHLNAETHDWLACRPECQTVNIGSSLKFCLLAEGKADLYPRLSRTMEWDTAAGDAVLRAAGGITETLDGKPLTYGKRNQPDDADFANPHFIARI